MSTGVPFACTLPWTSRHLPVLPFGWRAWPVLEGGVTGVVLPDGAVTAHFWLVLASLHC